MLVLCWWLWKLVGQLIGVEVERNCDRKKKNKNKEKQEG